MLRFSRSILWKLRWPGLVLLLVAVALIFPLGGASGAALMGLVALTGSALAGASPRFDLQLRPWARDAVIALVILGCSVDVFAPVWNVGTLRIYDWAPHHANLRHLVEGLREGHVPRWVQSVSTGDSPFELYAFLPYYLAARLALWTQTTDLTLVMVRSAILVHSMAALGAGLLARRVVAWPWALLVGLVTLYDVGSVFGGGVDGLFHMGVTHSALSNALWAFVLIAVIATLQRPHLVRSVILWVLVALAVVCHPLGLISALATIFALVAVALLATDVPAHRAAATAFHVLLGVLLVAFVWLPFGERLVRYGYFFSEPGRLVWEHFEYLLKHPVPEATVGPLVYAGYLGIVVAALSRRAVPTLLAALAGILFVGLFDQLYVLLDLVPSPGLARFQTVRLASAAKVAIYTCGVYLLATALAAVRAGGDRRRAWAMGALVALLGAGILRGGLPYFGRLTADLRSLADHQVPDPQGLRALAAWAKEQNEAMRPEKYGRLMDESPGNSYLVSHVNALSGLPSLRVGVVSAVFLRERIEDTSSASLRRFNVRWVMRLNAPPGLGDPATEKRFGRYFVRELPDWDGAFARVERGSGMVVVTRLEDERVEVELRGTEPALVALGMGYYPRWRAVHDQRGALPVYAMPSFEGSKLRVPAAWLPPGRITFTPSGPLPSDGMGRGPSGLAVVVALSIIVLWSGWPWRGGRAKVLRLMALAARWIGRRRRQLLWGATGLVGLGLVLAAYRSAHAPAHSLQIGNGLRGGALVEARIDHQTGWRRCGYSPLHGAYRCPGPMLVQDTTSQLLEDAPPSTAFAVPSIHVVSSRVSAEVRIRLDARLAGEYWAATNGGGAELAISGESPLVLSGRQTATTLAASERARTVTLTATVPPNRPLNVAFVRRDRLIVDRGYVSPPESAPFR